MHHRAGPHFFRRGRYPLPRTPSGGVLVRSTRACAAVRDLSQGLSFMLLRAAKGDAVTLARTYGRRRRAHRHSDTQAHADSVLHGHLGSRLLSVNILHKARQKL